MLDDHVSTKRQRENANRDFNAFEKQLEDDSYFDIIDE